MDSRFKRKFIEARKEAAKKICLEKGWPFNFFKISREDLKSLWKEKRWKFPDVYGDLKIEWGHICGKIKGPFGDLLLFEIEKDYNLDLQNEKDLSRLSDPTVSLELSEDKETLVILFNDSLVTQLYYLSNEEQKSILEIYESLLKEIMNLTYEKIYA